MTDYEQDLATRWTPSAEQDQAAKQALLDQLTCIACGRKATIGDSGRPYHLYSGVEGWVEDPTGQNAAHKIVPSDPMVVTAHLLVGKSYGWWGEGIEVVAVPGMFTDRNEASDALQAAADEAHLRTGRPVSGGWTYHHLSGGEPQRTRDGRVWQTRWAVFEDVLSVRPTTTKEG